MIEKLSERIVRYLESKKIIMDNREVYEYGFNLIIYELINLVMILLTSILLGDVNAAISYIIIFSIFRIFMGGYHEKSHIRCFISTFSLYMVFALSIRNIELLRSPVFELLFFSSLTSIWFICPVDTAKHRISIEIKSKFKIINRIICILLLVIYTLLNYFHYEIKGFYVIELISIYMGILCLVQFHINNREMGEKVNE
ncbi:MAG: accessory gene regulator B family protein [Erysipelotrichaceae bacterium]|uniref:accessory gene regulator B family protein n=1 Tax=Anaerorhabdus sp. TaxID=1872524 RepID=UPI002FC7F0F7